MKCSKKMLLVMAAGIGAGLLAGCSTKLSPEPFDANVRLTSGHVKMFVKKGVTTRLEIFKSLGAPNVIAMESEKFARTLRSAPARRFHALFFSPGISQRSR